MNTLIATDNSQEAEIITQILSNALPELSISVFNLNSLENIMKNTMSVIIFAFSEVKKAQILLNSLQEQNFDKNLYRTILLCKQEEIEIAKQVCDEKIFSHHLLFWPNPLDFSQFTSLVKESIQNLNLLKKPSQITSFENANETLNKHINTAIQNPSINPNDLALTQFQFGIKDNRPSILMIDDDPFQHKIVENILATENYQIKFALNFNEAIKILSTVKPKLILMDFMMPDLDGIDTTKRLKSHEKFSKVPILMVTGNSDIDVVKRSIHAGAIGFLVKPFSRNTLIAKLQSILDVTT